MCFSPEADFAAAAVLTPLGVLTLRAARSRAELPVAVVPMVFATHQFVEGFVWLGTQGKVSQGVFSFAIYFYLVIAQMVLPILVPLAIGLVEPNPRRRRFMWFALAIGTAISAGYGYILARYGASAYPLDHTMVYKTPVDMPWYGGIGYAIACGFTTLLSSHRHLVYFGILNIIGITAAGIVRYEAVTSIWCVYAAFISVLVLLFLRLPRTPSGPVDPRRRRVTAPAAAG